MVRSAGQAGAPKVSCHGQRQPYLADTADTGHFCLFMFPPSLPGGIRGQSFFVQVFGGDKQ
ncbi:MAG: hypothetical protein CBCREVIR_1186 [Candidatus Burkholderia crenata]|nr:MAG: hypothetical protein CBCREVIR_1186 [Candidatus Burkholderia crenata]